MAAFLSHHALLRTEPFVLDALFRLHSIRLPAGAKHRIERQFVLDG